MTYEEWMQRELLIDEEKGLLRTLHLAGPSEARTTIGGKPVMMGASNNYLGFANDPRVKEAAIRAIEKNGVGSGGARLTTGNMNEHEQLEKEIAAFKGTEAALIFSSGFLANVGTITTLATEGSMIFSDELNHASLIDGCRLSKGKTVVYKHADMKDLQEKLDRYRNVKRKYIVTDGVFSMDGDLAPLPDIVTIARLYEAFVIVDDAHATGVIGSHGRGSADYFGVTVDVTIGTMSKALGSEGGFVCGSDVLIRYLRQKARTFIFQTSLSPGVVAAARESIHLLKQSEKRVLRLQQISMRVRKGLQRIGYNVPDGITPIIPIIIGDAEDAVSFSKSLLDANIYIPAIRPPTVPQGSSRLRLALMATHTDKQVSHVLSVFQAIKE
ncbi:8-amino-7-oxononanoate synthase [Ectobacillus sp. sgz5001026]|uniref:8-amino-7-oxononanoate synthase n=1 Tax=Ectobacillus sp. sgz5001026 TaxID=3242473 RepID=UPI0036D41AB2